MRGRGVQSNMKRAYSKEEFYKILQILRVQEDFHSWPGVTELVSVCLYAHGLITISASKKSSIIDCLTNLVFARLFWRASDFILSIASSSEMNNKTQTVRSLFGAPASIVGKYAYLRVIFCCLPFASVQRAKIHSFAIIRNKSLQDDIECLLPLIERLLSYWTPPTAFRNPLERRLLPYWTHYVPYLTLDSFLIRLCQTTSQKKLPVPLTNAERHTRTHIRIRKLVQRLHLYCCSSTYWS
jgi:hypothetical protein